MSKIFNEEFREKFGEYLYGILPSFYREADNKEGNLTLQRYIDTLNKYGYLEVNNALVGIIDIAQINHCPEQFLDVYGESLGVYWIDKIPQSYKRKLLSLMVDMYKRKGENTAIEYLGKELSGFEVEIQEDYIPEDYVQPGDELKRLFTIRLVAPATDDPMSSKESEDTIKEVISHFVPVHSKYVLLISYFYEEVYNGLYDDTVDTYKIKEDRGTESRVFNQEEIVTSTLNMLNTYENFFNMLDGVGYDTDITKIVNTLEETYKLNGSFEEFVRVIQNLGEEEKDINTFTSEKFDKVVVKYISEDVTIQDTSENTHVGLLCDPNSVLVTSLNTLGTTSRRDTIIVNGQIREVLFD